LPLLEEGVPVELLGAGLESAGLDSAGAGLDPAGDCSVPEGPEGPEGPEEE